MYYKLGYCLTESNVVKISNTYSQTVRHHNKYNTWGKPLLHLALTKPEQASQHLTPRIGTKYLKLLTSLGPLFITYPYLMPAIEHFRNSMTFLVNVPVLSEKIYLTYENGKRFLAINCWFWG